MTKAEKKKMGSQRIEAVLQSINPEVFNKKAPLPLKIGIYFDIRKELPEAKADDIGRFLYWWTQRRAYDRVRKKAEAGETPRFDLYGNHHPSHPEKVEPRES